MVLEHAGASQQQHPRLLRHSMCRNTTTMARFRLLVSLLFILSSITASTVQQAVHRFIVEEGSDVTLLCSLGNDDSIEKMVFDWKKTDQEVFLYARGVHYNKGITGQDEQFRGRVSHFPEELKNGNASIVIRNTVLADSGNYTCIFPDFEPHRRFDVELVVRPIHKDRSAENIPGATPKPHIVILNATEDGVPLLCEVGGAAPKPTLQWQDSDGNVCPAEEPQVSERGGRYFVSLLATVTRTTTNRFRCVASQEDVHHRTHTDIDVPGKMFEECKPTDQVFSPDSMLGLGVLIGIILTVVVVFIVRFFIRRRRQGTFKEHTAVSLIQDTQQHAWC
uniref:Ig-like domain-containing protein n=1 Tax=Stegastes partitus TaxID=144197 RepID=A0A3B5AUQ5_9TELE